MAKWFQNPDAEAYVIIIGYFMAALLNPLANCCSLFLFFSRRSTLRVVPSWILVSNFGFLILQIIYLFYLNGTKHP